MPVTVEGACAEIRLVDFDGGKDCARVPTIVTGRVFA